MQVFADEVEPSQDQVVVRRVGLQLYYGFVLLNGQLQHFLGLRPGLRIADRTQINAAEKFARVQVGRIAIDDVLCFRHRVANPPGTGIKLRQTR